MAPGRACAAFSALALSLLVSGCTPQAGSEEVRAYVDEVVPLLQRGIKADGVDWEQRHQSTLDALYEADGIEETYSGLNTLAVEAGGPHSSFLSPREASDSETTVDTERLPTVIADENIGTLTLPAFNSSDASLEVKYATAALDEMAGVRASVECGWIVDLRDNSGGNMFPMLASVAPLLIDGTVLRLQGKSGESQVDIEDGRVTRFEGNDQLSELSALDTPVAVLTSSATSSAAEAVVISFLGQEGVRTFGTRTAGFTTGNEVFEMSDGARLVLTTGFMVDRNGISYDGPIEPDVLVNPRSGNDAHAVAQSWLAEQCLSGATTT